MDWIFNGIGTQVISCIISLIIGLTTGGGVGYKIGIKRTMHQFQKAGDNSRQEQIYIENENQTSNRNLYKESRRLNQVQKAGNNALQIQIGGADNEWKK